MSERKTIVLVEDDRPLATLISDFLRNHMFNVTVIDNGEAAVPHIQRHHPHLVLLDVMLPGKSGMDICKEIREFYHGPIMMLTALGENLDQILGLELGADDYIIKPVEPRVLLARIRTQLRRANKPTEVENKDSVNPALELGHLVITPNSRTVFLYQQEIPMTTAEFDLLLLLAKNAGQVLTRDQLLMALKGIDFDGLDRTIDIHISRLRRKLDDNTEHPKKIKTIRGKGYLLNRDGWQA
ncbi:MULTISPECIES: winged helix-turn-helix domain-containing protein [unclassified Serratia (in: enterobacteria)]|uniref:winged helix-turn-helix domain-containing protein n=1 Tax=unclassified Serratia (in: enterobacteria) TaxID=2647522 RepID=UPI0005041EB8|nr:MULTISPECIES: winged helix-turn-helix domain-containing protein [unclassified Serratia (in: enterobacteria)]KFK95428.1 chemotaxis protein CheY [Serratia sp. Ag2]KFK98776.1 chemotaxis protein CheY [Serratia sp. Ag1]